MNHMFSFDHQKKFFGCIFLQFLVIKTFVREPDPYPDSLEILNPDPHPDSEK